MTISLTPADAQPVQHGYSSADLDRFARVAVKGDYSTRGLDFDDRIETAWFGVVERLFGDQAQAPSPGDLIHAGRKALYDASSDEMHTRGRRPRSGCELPHTTPGFVRYWIGASNSTTTDPGFVSAIIDGTALAQIFARLTHAQREALLALATYEDYQRAAIALGLSKTAFTARLDRAREVFAALWHEHETPGPRRPDKRVQRRTLRPAVTATLALGSPDFPGLEVVLQHTREVFDEQGADRMHSRDLLAALATARPGIYTGWDQCDLASVLRICGVSSRPTVIDGVTANGYQLEAIVEASHPHQPPSIDPASAVLFAWLENERAAREAELRRTAAALATKVKSKQRPALCVQVLEWIQAAGPEGIKTKVLLERLEGQVHPATLGRWLNDEAARGAITRITFGRYAATGHQGAAEVAA